MKLIVGLGNPGKKYEHTRHNIGFDIVQRYVEINSLDFKSKFDGLLAETVINNEKVILLMPQTFMNLSGRSVSQVVKFFNIDIDDILIVFDDLDLQFGTIKLKKNSSSGGHNGIKDIINALNTKKFLRIKFGIKNEYKRDVKDFVLSRFTKDEQKKINEYIDLCCNIIDDFIRTEEATSLMNKYN